MRHRQKNITYIYGRYGCKQTFWIMIRKYSLITAGILALSAGIIGIFLPILPTTPFLLLAAYCFLKSSESLYRWLIHHRLFGKYIENYIKYRAIPLKSKVVSIVLLWGVILTSIFVLNDLLTTIILGLVACGVSIHLLLLKTLKRD